MSYYFSLTPEQRLERYKAFHTAFTQDDGKFQPNSILYELPKEQLTHVIDYVGYRIYMALQKRVQFNKKEITLLKYHPYWNDADDKAEALIRSLGVGKIKASNPIAGSMLDRFLKVNMIKAGDEN